MIDGVCGNSSLTEFGIGMSWNLLLLFLFSLLPPFHTAQTPRSLTTVGGQVFEGHSMSQAWAMDVHGFSQQGRSSASACACG